MVLAMSKGLEYLFRRKKKMKKKKMKKRMKKKRKK